MHWLLAIVLFTSVSAARAAAAEPEAKNTMVHVRPQEARITALLQEGMLRSRTLHALVDRIEASNVYVYVALDHLMKPYLAGRLTWMGQANEFRYLRASINFDLSSDQVISTIAHELQHAVEVLDDQAVVDEKSLAALYKRIGKPSRPELNSGWETDAAKAMGFQVRRELSETPTASLASLIDRGKS
jgi:hypothetical protein